MRRIVAGQLAHGRSRKRLRRGYVAGRLDTDTFSRRVDVALRASRGDELTGLTSDLPRLRVEPRRWFRRRSAGLLEGAAGGRLPLGRSPACQLVFADGTWPPATTCSSAA